MKNRYTVIRFWFKSFIIFSALTICFLSLCLFVSSVVLRKIKMNYFLWLDSFVSILIKFWFSTHILFFTYTVRKVSWFPIAKRLTNLRGKRYHSFIMTLNTCFSVACTTLSLNIENGYANMEGHSEPLGMESNTVSDRVPLTQVIAEVCFYIDWFVRCCF